MALGRKTGGRKMGTPNKSTSELELRLAALGCDPIDGMCRLAMDSSCSPELRGRMSFEKPRQCEDAAIPRTVPSRHA